MKCDPVNVCVANHTGLVFSKGVFVSKTGLIPYTFRLSFSTQNNNHILPNVFLTLTKASSVKLQWIHHIMNPNLLP